MDAVKAKKPLFVKFLVFFLIYSAYRYVVALISPQLSSSFNLLEQAGADWFYYVSSFIALALSIASIGLFFAKQGTSYITTKYFLAVNYLASFVSMLVSLVDTDRFMSVLQQYRPGRTEQVYEVMSNPATLAIMLLGTTVVYGLFFHYLNKNKDHFYYKSTKTDWNKVRTTLHTIASVLVILWSIIILGSIILQIIEHGL